VPSSCFVPVDREVHYCLAGIPGSLAEAWAAHQRSQGKAWAAEEDLVHRGIQVEEVVGTLAVLLVEALAEVAHQTSA